MAFSWTHGSATILGNSDLSGIMTLRVEQKDGTVSSVDFPGELLAWFVQDRANWAVKHCYRVDD